MKNKKQEIPSEFVEKTDNAKYKYFFIGVCILEIVFILWKFVFASTRNGGTFLLTFLIILALSLPPGVGVVLKIFRNRDVSFLFTFGLCVGFGLISGVWTLMIQFGCPFNIYIYIGVIFIISVYLIYRKRKELQVLCASTLPQNTLTELLSPVAVLLFAFIILSISLINNLVPADVDCQSDSYNTLMILKEGAYPIVSPFLDQTRLLLGSGPVFHTLIAVITKLKGSVMIKEIMAITIISGAFFCMAVYFIAKFLIKNEIILFLAGILTLTRAYLSCFNDGNLPENIAFYYGALFIVFMMYTIKNKNIIFAVTTGFCLAFCMFSHPIIFMYNFPVFGLFFVTLLISKEKIIKQDYLNLLIIMGVILILVIPYMYRIKEAQPLDQMHRKYATTLISSMPFWNGYPVTLLALAGAIILAFKRETINIYLWTYFIVIIIFIEHWRIYQIFSPIWFELKPLSPPELGEHYTYKDFLRYPMNYHSAWFCGIIFWPIGISVVVNSLYKLSQQYITIQSLKRSFVIFFVFLVLFFIGYEVKKSNRYPQFVLKSDFAALEWVKGNTSYKDTLIFAPFDNSNPQKVPNYWTSFWVPVVSERKSIIFRNYEIPGQFKFSDIGSPITDKVKLLQQAAYSISNPESYKVFKEMKVTHIFVSAFITGALYNDYQNSQFVELVHYDTMPDQGTAFVYKVK